MSILAQPAPVAKKKRGTYRRLLLVTALLLFGSIAGWMIWGAIRDWADAKALQEYFTELEAREPGWQDRVYGKPLTPAQLDDRQTWNELQKIEAAHDKAWGPYRQGLYGGMYQDPAQPAALFPKEQVEFVNAAHQYWRPLMEKVATMKGLPSHDRYIDRDVSYEAMYQQLLGINTSTAFITNEGIELEAMYHIMRNEPELALPWLTLCRPLLYQYYYSGPYLVERWLNLTQPKAASLLQMQQTLEQQSIEIEREGCLRFGAELRLTEKLIREISSSQMTQTQIQSQQLYETLLGRGSTWNTGWLKPARQYYYHWKVQSLFRRPDHLVLRLHQLADHVEELPRLAPAERWSTWKTYAQAHSIFINYQTFISIMSNVEAPDSDTIPEALYRLKAHYCNVLLLQLFNLHAQINTALVAVAAERFRLEKGRFPASWAELSPAYLSKPVLDPYTGKPLNIKLNEKGIVIYSVGQNGQDEGGDNLLSHHYWHYGGRGYETKNTNLGTRVYLPSLRRGPAFTLDEAQLESLKENTKEALRLLKEKKEE